MHTHACVHRRRVRNRRCYANTPFSAHLGKEVDCHALTRNNMDHLPDAILVDILLAIPTPTTAGCVSVCKWWARLLPDVVVGKLVSLGRKGTMSYYHTLESVYNLERRLAWKTLCPTASPVFTYMNMGVSSLGNVLTSLSSDCFVTFCDETMLFVRPYSLLEYGGPFDADICAVATNDEDNVLVLTEDDGMFWGDASGRAWRRLSRPSDLEAYNTPCVTLRGHDAFLPLLDEHGWCTIYEVRVLEEEIRTVWSRLQATTTDICTHIASSPDYVAAAYSSGRTTVWRSDRECCMTIWEEDRATCVALDRNTMVASYGAPHSHGIVHVWDLQGCNRIARLQIGVYCNSIALRDGLLVVSGTDMSNRGEVTFWDVNDPDSSTPVFMKKMVASGGSHVSIGKRGTVAVISPSLNLDVWNPV